MQIFKAVELVEVGIGVCNLIGFVAVCAALFFGDLVAT